MSMDIKVKADGLASLIKAFKGRLPYARVGIIGDDKVRTTAPAELTHEQLMRRATDKKAEQKSAKKRVPWTNAQIGARWEFDAKYKRSFLRVPLIDRLNSELNRTGAFKRETIEQVLKSGTLVPYVERFGQLGREIVLGAFETGGYGKWVPSNMKHKKIKRTLIESQQLLRSIAVDVKEKP